MRARARLCVCLTAALHSGTVIGGSEVSAPGVRYRPPAPPVGVVRPSDATIEVWVDLTLPPLATLPREARDERAALRERIGRQQGEVMAQLAALGAIEEARVQQVRNALAVRLPAEALERARRIPGVRGVHPVTHIKRETP